MQINLIYDPSVSSAPAGFKTAMNSAVQFLDLLFVDPITVNIQVGWGENNGQSLGNGVATGIFVNYTTLNYNQLTTDLANNYTSDEDTVAYNSLPNNDPTGGGNFYVSPAQEKAWGLLAANSSEIDGTIGFGTNVAFDFNPNNRAVSGEIDFIGVAEHELTHALGRVAGLQYQFGANVYTALDLFRYSAPGTEQFVGGQPAYFSIDGGATNLNNYDTASDYADWASTVKYDSFGYAYSGVVLPVSQTDVTEMDVLGFTMMTTYLQDDYLAVVRNSLSLNDAYSVFNSIAAGAATEATFVNSLLAQVTTTTIPAVAVEGSMYGAVGTSTEVTSLSSQFLPGQVAYAIQIGLDPEVFACLEVGLAFAFVNESGSTAFAKNYGPSNTAMPATHAGDSAFATAATNAIFGSAQTANTAPAILGYVHFLEGFFTANGIVGVQNPTAAQIDLAARAAAWGDGIAIALENTLGPLAGQTTNFLEDAAQGTAIYSASLSSQPIAAPFQGAATASVATTASVQVTGIAAPVDHIVM
jgi:hypothetical protein